LLVPAAAEEALAQGVAQGDPERGELRRPGDPRLRGGGSALVVGAQVADLREVDPGPRGGGVVGVEAGAPVEDDAAEPLRLGELPDAGAGARRLGAGGAALLGGGVPAGEAEVAQRGEQVAGRLVRAGEAEVDRAAIAPLPVQRRVEE